MSEPKFKKSVAARLKAIRKQRKLSLDAVAKLTGVSKAMLGQIERQESSPTIAKLWQIATGLDTSFSAFLDPECQSSKGQHFPNDPHMTVESLFPYSAAVNFEMHKITLTAHHCQHSEAHAQGVVESIVVLEGVLAVFADGSWQQIEQGGTLRFYADQPHGYKAITEKAVFQNIVSY